MGLNIRPSTSLERKLLFLETLLNGTDKVSKVSSGSVLDGTADGISKVTGKGEKDIMLAVSQLFPDLAFGEQLDEVAENFGVAPRLGALGSSTYVKLTAEPGTTYTAGTHIPSSTDGITFAFANNVTIGTLGFAYVKVDSVETGSNTNVNPLTISKLSPAPAGHINMVNEFKATGGQDEETDELERIRIKDGSNILARSTVSAIEQFMISVNPKVLKVFNQGTADTGEVVLSVATVNGSTLSNTELSDLLDGIGGFLALSEYKPFGTESYGIELRNAEYHPIDISYRCQLKEGADPDQVRIDQQTAMSKYLDPRYFDASRDFVDWTTLLSIVRNTEGMEYVPDQYFYPRADIAINTYRLPRIRSFLMLNLDGTVIGNFSGTLSPVYYPNVVDASYQASIVEM